MRTCTALLCLLSIVFCLGSAFAAEVDDNLKQLELIRSRIQQAETSLDKKQKSEVKISRELALLQRTVKQIDTAISDLSRQQRSLQQDIGKQEAAIRQGERSISSVGQRLRHRLVALYKEGDAGILKIIFSSESPTEMIQQYQYLTRIMEHDQQLLADYRTVVEEQQSRLAVLRDLEKQKTGLLERQQGERKNASSAQDLKARLLKQARSQQQQLKSEIAQLNEDAQQLKKLIADLKSKQQEPVLPGAVDFAKLKGKLEWPLVGRVLIGFGTQRDDTLGTLYESNGIEIATKSGQQIRSVAAGKVVFADYFKNYGNLLIVSHPGGFHTLYAQTDRIQKKVGEPVSAGDILGYSGYSGRESIYFEIRAAGAPVNPLSWLKKL